MKKLEVKNKFFLQVVLGFLFSGLVCINGLLGNDRMDEIVANNLTLSVVLFISIILFSLLTNYIFDCVKDKIFENPDNIGYILSILNYQVILFALVYFFMDALFDNVYIEVQVNAVNSNLILNISILVGAAIFYKFKNKKCTNRQFAKVLLIGGILVIQLNYIEILFFCLYFVILKVMEKNKSKISKVINIYKIEEKNIKKILGGSFFAFLSICSRDVYGLFISVTIMSLLLSIAHKSSQVYFNL